MVWLLGVWLKYKIEKRGERERRMKDKKEDYWRGVKFLTQESSKYHIIFSQKHVKLRLFVSFFFS